MYTHTHARARAHTRCAAIFRSVVERLLCEKVFIISTALRYSIVVAVVIVVVDADVTVVLTIIVMVKPVVAAEGITCVHALPVSLVSLKDV